MKTKLAVLGWNAVAKCGACLVCETLPVFNPSTARKGEGGGGGGWGAAGSVSTILQDLVKDDGNKTSNK